MVTTFEGRTTTTQQEQSMDQQPDEQSTDKEEEDDEDGEEDDIAKGTIHVANDKTVVPSGGLSTLVVLGCGQLWSSPVVSGGQSPLVVGGGHVGGHVGGTQVGASGDRNKSISQVPIVSTKKVLSNS
jgi:hypothetical protein